MAFEQKPPSLGNQYDDDRVLRSYLKRALPEKMLKDIEDELQRMGALTAGPLYTLHLAERRHEPVLTQWDAWGERIDHVEVTRLWKEAERVAAEFGLVATAYEQKHGPHSRLHQFALVHLFAPSTDLYACPLSMTDGAARTLLASGNNSLILDAVPHLTSRSPEYFWTSGQWMTERTGGSDVSRAETIARLNEDGTWRLYGRKGFASAITAQMALVLARPEDNPPGSKGLALFYVELRDEQGRLRNIRIDRLKDKLGTRKLPTAELVLDGTPAELVGELSNGVRAIAPMLNVTRTWNAVCAVALMRRGLALARDYARKREAFGAALARKPLHADTLAAVQAVYEGAFHLTYRVVELLGQSEAHNFRDHRSGATYALLRVLTPLAKLTTARQAVAVLSEVVEAFGGAGYVEDTGLPTLLRDAQALPIWGGTTNVLALDVLRALSEVGASNFSMLHEEVARCAAAVREPMLTEAVAQAGRALDEADAWLARATLQGQNAVEAGARRLALRVGGALELALLARHAQWSLGHEHDARAAAATHRLGVGAETLAMPELEATFALANDTALPFAGAGTDLVPEVIISEPKPKPRKEWGDGAPPPLS